MAHSQWALGQAIEIIKEYARGGGSGNMAMVLEEVCKKVSQLESESN